MSTRFRPFALALLLVALAAAPAAAAGPGRVAVFGSYWHEFLEYWKNVFQRQNGIVMGVLGVGVVALFIITRGKWRK